MKFIDLFSGIGGFRSALEQLGNECVAYSEIDKFAIQSYNALYDTEDEIALGDVSKISDDYIKQLKDKVDIVVGGSPCFRKGTLITTDNGLKPIETIKKGDKVLTHKNRFKKVIMPMVTHTKSIYKLEVRDCETVYVTEEHPFLVIEPDNVLSHWVKVKDLDVEKHFIKLGEVVNTTADVEFSPLLSLEKIETDESVYNFEVEDDNSYVANNLVAHNCQSFSMSGQRKGFEDTRGTLFFEYARVVKDIQPDMFLYENVKGMLGHDKGNTIRVVLKTFDELGYYIDFNIYNSKNYDVPQNRERIYITGKRKDLVDNPIYHEKRKRKVQFDDVHNWATENIKYVELLPEPKTEPTKILLDILEDEVEERFYLSEEKTKNLILEEDLSGNLNIFNFQANDRVHSPFKQSPTITTSQGGNTKPKIVVLGNTSKTGHGAHNVHSVGGLSPTVAARDYKGAKRIAIPNDVRVRSLTPLEYWRLQGFTDEQFYKAKNDGLSNSQLYKQAGNAVTVNVVKAIFEHLLSNNKK